MQNNLKDLNTSAFLTNHGIKPSYQRIRIFDYLKNKRNHPTVDQIYQELVQEIPTLSKTTVYSTLNLFIANKLATNITIEENEARYDADTSDHGHFKCLQCGEVSDFPLDAATVNSEKLRGYEVRERHLYLKGTCPKCLKY